MGAVKANGKKAAASEITPAGAGSESLLETISDAGLFEKLATAILRRKYPDCADAIHLGVNAQGKPVASRLDGLAIGHGADGRFLVAHHHTTCSHRALRGKWLGPDGDVEKAGAIIAEERDRAPGTGMILILTTNRVPDQTLIRDLHAEAEARGIALRLLDQSQIADFLDNHPDGQWLRRRYLGVCQTRLSTERLVELGHDSAALYQAFAADDPANWIAREIEPLLAERIARPGMTLLLMASGSGKTSLANRLLSRQLAKGGPGLWVPEHLFAGAMALEAGLLATLRQLAPDLDEDAGEQALKLAGATPLLVVVDDLNRLGDPERVARRLLGWLGRRSERQAAPPVHLLVPLWPEIFEQLPSGLRQQLAPFLVEAAGFSRAEAVAAVTRVPTRLASRSRPSSPRSWSTG